VQINRGIKVGEIADVSSQMTNTAFVLGRFLSCSRSSNHLSPLALQMD